MTKFTILVTLLIAWPVRPGLAWEVHNDPDPVDVVPITETVLLDPDSPSRFSVGALVGVEGSGAIRLKVELGPDPPTWSQLYVYDLNGVLRERIPAQSINDSISTIWTNDVGGGLASIGIEAPLGTSAMVQVTAVQFKGPIGELNSVSGAPEFEAVDVLAGDPLVESIPFLAQLIIDPNRKELSGLAPQESQFCSGILIGPNLLLTAGHCIYYKPEVCLGLIAIFGLSHDRSIPLAARRCEEIVYLGHSIDTALIRLDGTGPAGPFPVLSISQPSAQEVVRVLQHPRGTLARIARDSDCRVESSVTRLWPGSALADEASARQAGFSHRCDSLRGSSGAPILSLDGRTLLGVQHAGNDELEVNYAIRADVIRRCIGYEGPVNYTARPDDLMCK